MRRAGTSTSDSAHHILVVANQTCPCPALLEEIAERASTYDDHRVLIVVPALNSRLKHYMSDIDEAVSAARERLQEALGFLRDGDVEAEGDIGDSDPLVAIGDTLAGFRADEIFISTHPEGKSHWLERGLLDAVRKQVDVPVRHVISEYGAAAV